MIKRFVIALSMLLCLTAATALAADKSDWYDKSYNFKAIRSAMVYSMDFSDADGVNSDIEARELNEIYLDASQIPSYQMYSEKISAVGETTITITAELVDYKIEERLIPAHWETHTEKTKGRYKDRDGKWRYGDIETEVKEWVEDKYVDDSRVTIRFRAVDVSSGREIFVREEGRVHKDSTNRKGVFTRICKTFFSDFKKKMK